MNNRDYKQFAPGEYYHLYNRGNGKMDIFRHEEDYIFLLSRLREYLSLETTMGTIVKARRKVFPKDSFSLVSYYLMPNHFHFLIRQNTELPLSTLMLNLWSGYSKFFNKKYGRVGSLFQDQFKAVPIESDRQLKWLSAYIHQNPRVAKLVADAGEYPYSSYREYLGAVETALCKKDVVMGEFKHSSQYQKFVSESFESISHKKELDRIFID